MSRKIANERAAGPISAKAWSIVTGETPIEDSEGTKRPATLLLYIWYRDWLRGATEQSLTWKGTPLQADFEWISADEFLGRPMRDVAEELESAMLEQAARAVDSHDPSKGPLIAWMKLVMLRRLADEAEVWAATSTDVEFGTRVDINDILEGLRDTNGQKKSGRLRSRALKDLEVLTAPPVLQVDPEKASVDREMVEIALGALTPIEARALELFGDDVAYSEIARIIGVANATSARRIVERAQTKAREAING